MEGAPTILKKYDIPGGDPRWPVSVEVQRRTKEDKTYINLTLTIGTRRIFIPRRVASDIADTLKEASRAASEAYKDLLREANP